MKLKILHIMSQMELTGAEVYALALADHQHASGHDVVVMADELHIPTKARFESCPIYDRSYPARVRNLARLRKFVLENDIDVVHAHSRAASWVASYALKFTKIPLISTVHGRQHWHGRFKKNDVYGDKVIAVCENIRTHLVHEFGLRSGKVVTLGNPIEWEQQLTPTINDKLYLTVLGRTTGPKGERASRILEDVVPILLREFPYLHVQFSGGPFAKLPVGSQNAYHELVKLHGERIKFLTSNEEFWKCLLSSDIVVASGRIAAESLGRGLPTFAVGEAIVHGMIQDQNLDDAIRSNFGDVQAQRLDAYPFDTYEIAAELSRCIRASFQKKQAGEFLRVNDSIVNRVRRHYDAPKIFHRVERIYRLNIFKARVPRPIPVLMYHKVPERPIETKHKIFVTKGTFRRQMQILKKRGFTTLDFHDLKRYLEESRQLENFPKKPILLTFDDGYKDNLENAAPILKEFGFKGTVFVLSDRAVTHNVWDTSVDPSEPRHELMNTEQIQLCASQGLSVGSHGRSHRDLTSLPVEESWDEIRQSKLELENQLKSKIVAFAYPYGKYDSLREQQTFEAGYDFAVATDSGALRLEENPYAIFRVNIFPQDLGLKFVKKISSFYRRYYLLKRGK
jgi:peptidoglycan/xylan/chitin deacetylase (PgdA/CDA1 family)/glycosyltransferase involved in cell wall biosynthesis